MGVLCIDDEVWVVCCCVDSCEDVVCPGGSVLCDCDVV